MIRQNNPNLPKELGEFTFKIQNECYTKLTFSAMI
jgi:hypothetical protein